MLKHIFGLSRGDKNAKLYRLKIIEIMQNKDLKNNRPELQKLLVN